MLLPTGKFLTWAGTASSWRRRDPLPLRHIVSCGGTTRGALAKSVEQCHDPRANPLTLLTGRRATPTTTDRRGGYRGQARACMTGVAWGVTHAWPPCTASFQHAAGSFTCVFPVARGRRVVVGNGGVSAPEDKFSGSNIGEHAGVESDRHKSGSEVQFHFPHNGPAVWRGCGTAGASVPQVSRTGLAPPSLRPFKRQHIKGEDYGRGGGQVEGNKGIQIAGTAGGEYSGERRKGRPAHQGGEGVKGVKRESWWRPSISQAKPLPSAAAAAAAAAPLLILLPFLLLLVCTYQRRTCGSGERQLGLVTPDLISTPSLPPVGACPSSARMILAPLTLSHRGRGGGGGGQGGIGEREKVIPLNMFVLIKNIKIFSRSLKRSGKLPDKRLLVLCLVYHLIGGASCTLSFAGPLCPALPSRAPSYLCHHASVWFLSSLS
ncbi:hypothetical protein E2C01_009806 [Portunus trituberculatus]|uniref:Uncharacterized protein n=1 Tax=Portunus trituberculatus TaxID=210409 RepID=A0A5B7D6P3_PORTR|nr:hypothetical protein [Portunus trituberculatus]